MNAISRANILSKTHYGLSIYSHILRLYYPDEVVLRLVGRDCGLCRNPFNSYKETLHIWIEKTDPTNVMSAELARHEDSANAIPAGNAFDFAELHYKQSSDELLQTLNKELYLHIGQERNFYKRHKIISETPLSQSPQNKQMPISSPCGGSPEGDGGRHLGGFSFSFFKAPISNTKPHKAVSLLQIYNVIKGDYYKDRTQKLRAMLSPLSCGERSQARLFKAANFDYCTFSGVFTTRNDNALVKHSGLLCLDFDHLQDVELLRNQLLQDEYFDTQLLFRSPSDNGLKWIIPIDTSIVTHGEYFASVANYIKQTYGIEVDKSGRDISRACFLPHDGEAYINPTHLKQI